MWFFIFKKLSSLRSSGDEHDDHDDHDDSDEEPAETLIVRIRNMGEV